LLATGLVNPITGNNIQQTCDWDNMTAQCYATINKMYSEIDHVNMYNIYGSCIYGESNAANHKMYKAPLGSSLLTGNLRGPDACINSILASSYFNRPEVQAAFHVRKTTEPWSVCYQEPGWSYSRTRPNLPRDTYPTLLNNIPVYIYNGDWDACVPHTDNYAWTSGMNYPTQTPWHVWTFSETTEGQTSDQVGGYAVIYQGTTVKYPLTYLTVKGGRHEVPMTAPLQAFNMLTRIITGKGF